MPSATIIASAISVLVIVCAVIAVALNLSSAQDASKAAILLIPNAYTATFRIDWLDLATLVPTGYVTDGILSVELGTTSFAVHSLLNGTAQMLTTYTEGLLYGNSECIGAADAAGFMGTAVKQSDALSIEPERADQDTCPNGFLYSVNAFYANHLLCIKDRVLQWVTGDAYKLTVTSFVQRATYISPPLNADMSKCYLADSNGTVLINDAPNNRRRLRTFTPAPHSVIGKPKLYSRMLSTGVKHVCFMHGMGQDNGPADQNMANSGAAYWGNIKDYVSGGAAYTHAIHVNTRFRGWDSVSLQDEYYEYIKRYKCSVVFAHSMGNVILAALAARGKPVNWYMTQGPMRGSWGASWADGLCKDGGLMGGAANLMGYCAGSGGTSAVKSLVVRNYKTTTSGCELGSCPENVGNSVSGWYGGAKELSWSTCWHCSSRVWGACIAGYPAGTEVCADSGTYLIGEAASYIKGRMCGTSSYGMGGFTGAGLAAISAFVGYGEASDGMVAMSSCAQSAFKKGQLLKPDATSVNYLLNGNHQDGTCKSGNGAGGDQWPCVWFRNMIARDTGCAIPGFC